MVLAIGIDILGVWSIEERETGAIDLAMRRSDMSEGLARRWDREANEVHIETAPVRSGIVLRRGEVGLLY